MSGVATELECQDSFILSVFELFSSGLRGFNILMLAVCVQHVSIT